MVVMKTDEGIDDVLDKQPMQAIPEGSVKQETAKTLCSKEADTHTVITQM